MLAHMLIFLTSITDFLDQRSVIIACIAHFMLQMYQSVRYNFFRTLDDEELHVQQVYFTLDDLKDISLFLKQLLYKLIMDGQVSPMMSHCHTLLSLLHNRDCRRSFTLDKNFWIEP